MWGDLDPWLASLWSSLLQLKPLPSGTVVDDTPRLEPALFTMTPVVVTASGSDTDIAAGSVKRLRAPRCCVSREVVFSVVCFGFGALR